MYNNIMSLAGLQSLLQLISYMASKLVPRCDSGFVHLTLMQKGKKRGCQDPLTPIVFSYARSTFPDLRQEVQTYILRAAPLTLTLTDFTLDFHILFDRL